jgi:WD40 repeat protein
MLAVGDANGETLLWATSTGRLIATLRPATTAKILAVAFSPNGALAAAGTSDGRTYLWSTTTGRLLAATTDTNGRQVNAVAFSPDGSMLATGDGNGEAFLWKVSDSARTLTLARTLADPLGQGIWSVAFSPDGSALAAGDYQGTTCLWHLTASTSPILLAKPTGQSAATAVAISPDGSTLAVGYLDGSVSVWGLATHTPARAHPVIAVPASVWGAAFSRHGLLALAAANGKTYLVNPMTGAAEGTLTDPATGRQGVGAVAFMPDGESLIAGDTNGTTYLWHLPSA